MLNFQIWKNYSDNLLKRIPLRKEKELLKKQKK